MGEPGRLQHLGLRGKRERTSGRKLTVAGGVPSLHAMEDGERASVDRQRPHYAGTSFIRALEPTTGNQL
jgi:hypothetical protein